MLEYVGYLASLIILVSLLMSSVKKLRWINLLGSLIFMVYGYLNQVYPVAVMNGGIVIINVVYLFQMYKKKDYFRITPLDEHKHYFDYFMSFYESDIKSFIKEPYDLSKPDLMKIFILRNTVPAGVFIGKASETGDLEVYVDYVTPQYRDFKVGNFLFENEKQMFLDKGIKRLVSAPGTEKHEKYLIKMGFDKVIDQDQTTYIKELV